MKINRKLPFATWTFAALVFCSTWLGATEIEHDYRDLTNKIRRLAADPPGRGIAGIYVAEVHSGKEIFAQQADKQLNPASNVKVVTAACALKKLGPEFRFVTSIHGNVDGTAVRGPLYLKGHADPLLSTADLWEMAQELRKLGVRRVEGGVVVDDTYFDGENLPFAYDQQPNEDAAFRAPVGAVSLNFNTMAVTIAPSASVMKPARVIIDPPEYAVVTNDTVTIGQGAHNPKISTAPFTDRTKLRVWGQIPAGSRPVTYPKRADNPTLLAGYGLKGVLEKAGIRVGGGVQRGRMATATPKLAEHHSVPLSEVLWWTGKKSNNFVTEMVLKTMGAEADKEAGTWENSVAQVNEVLAEWGLEPDSYTYRNGSGLFDANRFSARQFVTVLTKAYLDNSISPEFVAQLATGGVDGTIKSRYQGASSRRYVRAKTGTLNAVSALTGYVFEKDGPRVIAFSILVNKVDGYVSASRAYQEKIVTQIADYLNK